MRPTADRVRETLFNWLQPHIGGAQVLDAFTGSGALALESLSRGAAQVTAWDRSAAAITALNGHAATLGLAEGQQLRAQVSDALKRLQTAPNEAFDIVMLDPPFRRNWWPEIFAALEGGWLRADALVYAEFERELVLPTLPAGWQMYRQQTAGQVTAALLSCN